MPRFYQYADISKLQPVPQSDISWLAGQVSRLPPFLNGTAVLCGSVAWGLPSWRSDIDIAIFRTTESVDIEPAISAIVTEYQKSTGSRFLVPRVDTIIVGAESQQLVTRKNLVRGSTPITEMRTILETFNSTSLRFFDHVGSLARAKGDPWRTFQSTYLAHVARDRDIRRNEIRTYVSTFADTWRQQPLRSLGAARDKALLQDKLDMMGFAENFPNHLMRQILAERDSYPVPDRASDVRASFAGFGSSWAVNLLRVLNPFFSISEKYSGIVAACKLPASGRSAKRYYSSLTELFDGLPFSGAEESVWDYLNSTG